MARTSVLGFSNFPIFHQCCRQYLPRHKRRGYVVFAKLSWNEVVDKIKQVPTTTRNGYSDVPVTNRDDTIGRTLKLIVIILT